MIISANRNADSYARYGEVVGDGAAGLEDRPGPLAGVMAGLLAAGDAQWLVVAPCDTPFLPPDWPRAWSARRWRCVPLAYASADGVHRILHGAAGVVAARIA